MISPVQPQKDDVCDRLRLLLARGSVSEALEYASGLHASGAMDADHARTLLQHSRDWYIKGLLQEQERACELVLACLPDEVEALHLLGFLAQTRGDYTNAEAYYVRVLAQAPRYAFSRLALGQLRMRRSLFGEGRDLYEARFDAVTEGSGPDWRGLPIARWHGESLAGKKLYLWAEQGLGDIAMFAGFLPHLLAQSPARITLAMFPKLLSLFARSFPQIEVESIDDAAHHALGPMILGAFPQIEKLAEHTTVPFSLEPLRASYEYMRARGVCDLAAPLGDVLVHCLSGFVPARQQASHLVADPERVKAARGRLQKLGKGRYVGISWHTTNIREVTRNIPLEQWLPVLRAPDCHFVSLQHHVSALEIETFCKAHDCTITLDSTDILQDAEGLAALIAAMDEVVTIDNSNAHLAGALGIKTTLLLPKGSNFRWPELENNVTLWYRSVKTLRQKGLFDWETVMLGVAAALASPIRS